MAFNLSGAAGGAAGGGAMGAQFGPWGAGIGAVAGGLLGGFGGGSGASNNQMGFSSNSSERQQRMNELAQRTGLEQSLTQQDLFNYFLSGQYNPSSLQLPNGQDLNSAFQQVPGGPAFNLVNQSLQSEVGLSNQRNQLANQLLGQFGQNNQLANTFGQAQLGYGQRALGSQEQLFQQLYGSAQQNLGLEGQLTDSLSGYLQSGGAPSQAQQQNISGIFDAQRNIGQSNLSQQFGDSLRQLQDQATTRGLRFNDTPIQDRGGLLAQEFARNATNLESSLGGQQAQMQLQIPMQNQAMNWGGLGQTQGQFLNALNAFSSPINNAFGQQNALQQMGQFGLQYAPGAFAGAPLQNMNALLGGGQFASGVPAFSNPSPAAQQPGFAQNLASSFGSTFGAGLGRSASGSVAGGLSNIGLNSGGGGNPYWS